MDFIGRKVELDVLERAFRSPHSEFIPVYGRRRVGKTELILKFIRRTNGLYFLGKQAFGKLQIQDFLRAAATALSEPLLAEVQVADWKSALLLVTQRWKRKSKLVIALDEFQWMADASRELPSVLQECWDQHWKKTNKIVLILSGSYIGFMEREVLGNKSPLFGRRTAQIFLKPFGYREAALFHPRYGRVDQAKAYFLCGGLPLYLRYFDGRQSIDRNIVTCLLDEYSALGREPDFLLREELRDVANYYAILMSLANGHSSVGDLARQTSIPERSLPYYLNQLIDLGYLARRYPLTGRKPMTRHVRFELDDPLLRFWFRFIYPNKSLLAQVGPQAAFQQRIAPELESYFGTCFERLCREAMPYWYEREGISTSFEVGQYWDKSTQIDLVGIRNDGWIDLGECKWGGVASKKRVQLELKQRVELFPNPTHATLARHVFLKSAGRKNETGDPSIQWHSLDDLYA